jgi:hypothetical protein
MKAKKVLKRLGKIDALILKVTEQSSPDIRELLRDAKAAVIRAKEAVQASFETLKNLPARHPSKATPEASKPILPAAGRKGISGATKKRPAAKKAAVAKPKKLPDKKAAVKKSAKAGPSIARKATHTKTAAPLKARASARTVPKKAPAKKAALKTPAKKAVKVVRAAKTPIPPTLEVTAAERPEEVMQESVVQEVETTAVETPEQAVPEGPSIFAA